MSNIYTEHARLYFRPGASITTAEIESLLDRVLDERGSYWVPVWYESSWPSHLDLQYGSGKSASLYNLEPEELICFEEVWVRFANEGADEDVIYEWAPALDETPMHGYPRKRACLYAFDEVHVVFREKSRHAWIPEGLPWQPMPQGFRAPCSGHYRTLNERADMEIGPRARLHTSTRTPGGFATPTTPCHGSGDPTFAPTVPPGLVKLMKTGQDALARVDLLHAGRIVHRAEHAPWHDKDDMRWQHRSADHWDNCADEAFVRLRGAPRT